MDAGIDGSNAVPFIHFVLNKPFDNLRIHLIGIGEVHRPIEIGQVFLIILSCCVVF